MEKPFFSIVIPTFNQSQFLEVALKSVFRQTFKSFEVIIIDNNSKDSTKEVIKKYKDKIIFKKISNKGIIAKSRNLGIRTAKGKWIAFLDSDDCWSKDKLLIVKKIINKNNIDVICHSEWIINLEKNKIKLWSYGPYENKFYEKLLKYGNRFSTSASLVKKDFLNKKKILFNENKEFISSEDYGFFLSLAKKNARFNFEIEPLGYHFFHKQSTSANLVKHLNSTKCVLKFHLNNTRKIFINKKKIWLEIKNFLNLKTILFNIKKNSPKTQIKKFAIFFINNPIFSSKYLCKLVTKKINDKIVYLIYRSKIKELDKIYQ